MGLQYHYSINQYQFPVPSSSSWERIPVGARLSTNLPFYSPYQRHIWRYSGLPIEICREWESILDALIGTELDSLITVTPSGTATFQEYTDAKVMAVTRTHALRALSGIEITMEVFVG